MLSSRALATVALLLAALACPPGARTAPSTWSFETESSAVQSVTVHAPGHVRQSSTTQTFSASLLHRSRLREPWYWEIGGQVEEFRFPGYRASTLPGNLRDFAGVVSVSYFEGDEAAAQISFRPGWYYGGHFSRHAWDVPVEAISGIPLFAQLDAVFGVSNARFYHHAIPIAGIVLSPLPRLRFEAAYPEPAVIFKASDALTLRCAGQLIGGGFLESSSGTVTAVEYSSYRVGLGVDWKSHRGIKLTAAVGAELERAFDRFHRHERWSSGRSAPYARLAFAFNR